MKKLEYNKPHNVDKLREELENLPELKPIKDASGGFNAVFNLGSDGKDKIVLYAPDTVDTNKIDQVISAHVPVPPSPSGLEVLRIGVNQKLIGSNWDTMSDKDRWDIIKVFLIKEGYLTSVGNFVGIPS
jgi:hypothetical protein